MIRGAGALHAIILTEISLFSFHHFIALNPELLTASSGEIMQL